MQYAKTCVAPAYEYFQQKFDGELKPQVEAFKAARIFLPCKASEMKPTTSDIDQLKCFNFDLSLIEGLKTELATYMTCCDSVSPWVHNHIQGFLQKPLYVTGGEIMNLKSTNGLKRVHKFCSINHHLPQLRGYFHF